VALVVLATVAFAASIGVVYALGPTFAAIAVVLLLGLGLFYRSDRLPRSWLIDDKPLETTKQRSQGDLTSKLVSGFLLVWWLTVVLALGHVWTNSPYEEAVAIQNAVEGQQGVLLNQLVVLSFGVVGITFFVAAMNRFSATLWWIIVLWLLYLCWGIVTLFWSVDLFASIRRLSGFALISFGAIGFGAGFYGSHPYGKNLILRHIVVGGVVSALALLIPLAFRRSEVNLLDPGYYLETTNNIYSYVAFPVLVALLVLFASSMLNLRRWRGYDWLLAFLLMLVVFILKSRGPVLAMALALSTVYFFYRARAQERVFQIGVLISLLVGMYIAYTQGILDLLLPYLTKEAPTQQTLSLTGRIPLWQHLLLDAEQHPLIGVGFGAYWTATNLIRAEQVMGWPYVVAHNGYIEELLATGAVGLSLLLLFWAFIMHSALKRAYQGDNFGWLTVSLVLFYLLANITQSFMQWYHELVPFCVPLALVGLMESTRPTKHSDSVNDPGIGGP
jgi:exopolysaccharide production protein ExoQ